MVATIRNAPKVRKIRFFIDIAATIPFGVVLEQNFCIFQEPYSAVALSVGLEFIHERRK